MTICATALSSSCADLRYFKYADDDHPPARSTSVSEPLPSTRSCAIPLRKAWVPVLAALGTPTLVAKRLMLSANLAFVMLKILFSQPSFMSFMNQWTEHNLG